MENITDESVVKEEINVDRSTVKDDSRSVKKFLLETQRVISVPDIMASVSANLYYMAPKNSPRNIETIMNKFYNELMSDSDIRYLNFSKDFLYFDLSIDEMGVKIENKLNNIQEFRDLNLSQNEIDAGITVDDPNRPKYNIISAYDSRDENYWKDDFIDLNAAIRNIERDLLIRTLETIDPCCACVNKSNPHKCIDLQCGRFYISETQMYRPLYKNDYFEQEPSIDGDENIMSVKVDD